MSRLSQAAEDYAKGLKEGIDEDDLVAKELGKDKVEQLTDVQQKYKDKIKARLAQEAEQRRREQAAKSRQFTLGKIAYGKGLYPESRALLEQALNQEGPFSKLGGEIQLWLALAYQACGQEAECISTYKLIEDSHPSPKVRKQAADLRYIMEAPKLKLRPEERINLPLLGDLDRYVPDRKNVPRPKPPPTRPGRERQKSWQEEFWDNYKYPEIIPSNRYVWAASIVLGAGLAWYSATLK